jgi:membrane-bound metal-dependent hydrolase YbcI (DUF457 family)
MPSPIGHALAGVGFVWSVRPRAERRLVIAAATLAALPDIDILFPGWHRAVTHSVGFVILTFIVAAAVTGQVTRRVRWGVALICAGAYATHLLLDYLGADHVAPYGIRALWPFNDGWYISGLDIFRQTARRHLVTIETVMTNVEAIAQEIAILGPIVWLLWLVRVKPAARLAPELTGRHHPTQ